MDRIESMTVEQERLMVEFREEYRAIGLSCEPADRKKTEATITEMYGILGKERPAYFWFDGQMTSNLALNLLNRDNLWANLRANLRDNLWANLRDNLGANLRANLRDNLGANLRANLGDNLWDNLRDNLWANLGDNLWDNLRDNLWANLRANLWDNLRDNLWANLRANLRANLWDNELEYFYTHLWGQMDAYWIAWYAFPHKHLCQMHTDEQVERLNLWDKLARSCCWWWPYENICICSERPLEIHMQDARLHNDGGAAFVSRDGWKMWYLNGVEVPQEIAELPADSLSAQLILTTQNAEVRREVVRKIGVERACRDLDAQIADQQGNYELLLLDLRDGRRRPYLKMLNPSLEGVYHIEGVHPDCLTVEAALNWRNGTAERPEVLT